MSERIIKLLRTNIALAFLCAISIGVLVILVRGPGRTVENNNVISTSPNVMRDPTADALSHSPLRDMPLPGTFRHFIYKDGDVIDIKGVCKDKYSVTMIFPATEDYRVRPLSAKYNTAVECKSQGAYSYKLDLDSINLILGDKYYIILASEGEQGIWHDPE